MPTYRPAVYGIQLSEALAEAAAAAPVTRTILQCIELTHPTLATPIRVVADTDDVTVTHEGGASATYLAAPVTVPIPEESPQSGTPEIVVVLAHVNGQVKAALDGTRSSLQPWTITERIYASDDLTGPARLPPLSLQVTSVEWPGDHTARLSCSFGDPANRAVPKLTFRSTQYTGLQAR